jgi:hypothetical protein
MFSSWRFILAVSREGLSPPEAISLGISILDTRCLQPLISTYLQRHSVTRLAEIEYHSILETYSFICGLSNENRKEEEQVLFGETEEVIIEDLNTKMQALIQGRDVVLVVHGETDVRLLDRLHVVIPAIYIIDTQKAAQNPLRLGNHLRWKSF